MINSKNPFLKPAIVNAKNIWGEEFYDFAELNSDVSEKIIKTLNQVQNTFSIAVVGDVGTGKTQLFSRIRHQLLQSDSSFGVYISADQISSLDFIAVAFQQFLVDSLCHRGNHNVTHLQEIATHLVNQSLKSIGSSKQFSPEELVETFDKLAASGQLVQKITKQIQQTYPYLKDSSQVIQSILWTLSASNKPILDESLFLQNNSDSECINHYLSPSAIDWLKGIEIPEEDARIMRLTARSYKDQDREAEALNRTLQLLRIVSEYRSVVICFDELDAARFDTHASRLSAVIANFIKTLHNNIDNVECRNSILLLSLWVPSIWERETSSSSGDGLTERLCSLSSLNRKPIELKSSINEAIALNLVSFWLRRFSEIELVSPYYPFSESKIREFARNKPTPRQLWRWCAENWEKVDKPAIDDIEEIYNSLKDKEYPQLMEDESVIVNSLIFCFDKIISQTVENVLIRKTIKQPVNAKFQFKIEGMENGNSISIGVGVCQSANANTVNAMLKRLIEYPTYNLSRGCLVRAENKRINPNTQTYRNLKKLIDPSTLKGEFVDLKYCDVVEVYALYLLSKQPDLDLTVVSEFINRKIMENSLVKEILSDPSGSIPNAVISDINYQQYNNFNENNNTRLSEDNFEIP